MKNLLCGMMTGFIIGAFVARNCKPCAKLVDEASDIVESKIKEMKRQTAKYSNCECGCDYAEDCQCDNAQD